MGFNIPACQFPISPFSYQQTLTALIPHL